jgi:chemotaxis signal transduction protein
MNAEAVAIGATKPAVSGRKCPFGEAATITLMLLRLGKRWFGVDVQSIEDVALKSWVTRVPTAPSHILGVATVRGRLVTVVGLERLVTGVGTLSRENSATLPRLVVMRADDYEMAVVADSIQGMTEYQPVPDAEPTQADVPPFIRGEFDWRGRRVSVLDAPLLIAAAAKLAGVLSPSEEVEP